MMRGLLSSFTSNSVRSQLTQGLPFSCSLMFFFRTLENVFLMFVYVMRMHFLTARRQIDFGKITTSFSCVVRSCLSCTKTTGLIFLLFFRNCWSSCKRPSSWRPSIRLGFRCHQNWGRKDLTYWCSAVQIFSGNCKRNLWKSHNAACPQQGIFESYMYVCMLYVVGLFLKNTPYRLSYW